MNLRQIAIALAALLLGALFYLLLRPPGTTYFIPETLSMFFIDHAAAGWLSAVPSFFHGFAFVLLTVGVLGCRQQGCLLWVAVFWLVVDGLFELAQHQQISQWLITHLPAWFEQVVLLENVDDYLLTGRFDVYDMLGLLLGVGAAYLVAIFTNEGEKYYENDKK